MGRHWLTSPGTLTSKGYVFEQERRFSHSFTYRDWVVNALNRDLPTTSFSSSRLPAIRSQPRRIPGPWLRRGFLTLGRRFSTTPGHY